MSNALEKWPHALGNPDGFDSVGLLLEAHGAEHKGDRIIYRDYEITREHGRWIFFHVDYDGAPVEPFGPPGDHRSGDAKLLLDALTEIDSQIEEEE